MRQKQGPLLGPFRRDNPMNAANLKRSMDSHTPLSLWVQCLIVSFTLEEGSRQGFLTNQGSLSVPFKDHPKGKLNPHWPECLNRPKGEYVDGQNPAPLGRWFVPLIEFHPSNLMQEFVHPQCIVANVNRTRPCIHRTRPLPAQMKRCRPVTSLPPVVSCINPAGRILELLPLQIHIETKSWISERRFLQNDNCLGVPCPFAGEKRANCADTVPQPKCARTPGASDLGRIPLLGCVSLSNSGPGQTSTWNPQRSR